MTTEADTTTMGVNGLTSRVLSALGKDPTHAFVLINRAGQTLWATDSVFALFDVDLRAHDPLMNAVHPDDAALCAEIFGCEQEGAADETFDLDRRFELIARLRSPSGAWRAVAMRLLNLVDDPEVDGMLLQLRLVNQEHSTIEAFDAAALGAPVTDVIGRVIDALRSGGSGDSQAAVFDVDGRCVAATNGAGIEHGELRSGTAWQRLSNGRLDVTTPIHSPTGDVLGVLETVSNFPDVRPFTSALTESIARRVGLLLDGERTREELRTQAARDSLTGVHNRRSLRDRFQRTDLGDHASVAFVDLNGFKSINDDLGHDVGDHVLIEVARRLTSMQGESGIVVRIGGDEFAIVRHGSTADECLLDAPGIRTALNKPVLIGDRSVALTASVGVASGPAARREALLSDADAAMYLSKRRRRHDDREPAGD
jgi:diguanylate cyclase (GGDEF)-like protein